MLRLCCAAVLTAALGIWLIPGKAGYIFGLTFAVIVVFALIARELFRLPRCPACKARPRSIRTSASTSGFPTAG